MLTIFRPVESDFITQKFGENLACFNPKTRKTIKRNVCPTGYVSLYEYNGLRGHPGIDFGGYMDEPIYFPISDGLIDWEVRQSVELTGNKKLICYSTSPIVEDKYVIVKFMHLNRFLVQNGARIRFGDVLGTMGNSGTTRTHLHMEIYFCDKQKYVFNIDNGYGGAQDFEVEPAPPLWVLGRYAKLNLKQKLFKFFFHLSTIV